MLSAMLGDLIWVGTIFFENQTPSQPNAVLHRACPPAPQVSDLSGEISVAQPEAALGPRQGLP